MRGIKLDLKDKKILFELDFHARDSNAKIAKKVRLSKQGVDYKIRNMINKGVIQGFAPIINGNQLGYFYGRLFIKFQNLTREKENKITYKEIILQHMYYADFVLFDKIILEVKDINGIIDEFIKQTLNYLSASNNKLGIIVNFGEDSLKYKRLVL